MYTSGEKLSGVVLYCIIIIVALRLRRSRGSTRHPLNGAAILRTLAITWQQ